MTLLIVDDEIYAIQGILDGIEWERLEFDRILTANSYAQALTIFQNESVDVMISDIEMPYGSGLELVEWVRKNHPDTECIFLTYHDEFDFAKKAIKLQCLDYVLKPVPPEKLSEILIKAIEVTQQKQRKEHYAQYGKHYLDELSDTDIGKQAKPKDIVNEIEQIIRKNLSETKTVEELARQVYLSPDHLTRLFKKEKGQTVIEYITHQSMFWAKELLEQNELTISRISAKVGYGNYSYFTKVFKKYYGKTPREYQSDYLKKNP